MMLKVTHSTVWKSQWLFNSRDTKWNEISLRCSVQLLHLCKLFSFTWDRL